MRKYFARLALSLLGLAIPAFTQTLAVDHAKICHTHSGKYRMLFCTDGVLTFDDSGKTLAFKGKSEDNRALTYDDIEKIVFEETTHMRGGAWGTVFGPAGTAIAGQHVDDYWMYVAPKGDQATPLALEIKKEESQKVIDKAKAVFGDRVTIAEFAEKGEEIDKDKLKDLQSKYHVKMDRQDHPVPELKPDKALVVVVCRALLGTPGGDYFKLYANDRVVAVNVMGTYSFAYLDPGRYLLVSQSENANGFEMDLEAGKDYYFLQNIFEGGRKAKTSLTRNSKELVMYQLDSTYHSNWVRQGDSPSK